MDAQGELKKVEIAAFDNPKCEGKPIGSFSSFVNPNEITLAYEMEYDAAQGAGSTGSRMDFKGVKPGDLSLSFFIDGTGANGKLPRNADGATIDTQKKVHEFQRVTGYNGKVHRTNYLKMMWGTLTIRYCVLKSVSIVYKLFTPNGVPLRAVIAAVFTDTSDDETRLALAQDQSPDLTHIRLVKAGDNLPALCFEIYRDPRYYVQVARQNGLNNFRRLVPGTRICFPPLGK